MGCASPGLNNKDYHNRLGTIQLGMTKSEFKQVFPERIPMGAKQYPKCTVEVLEVSYEPPCTWRAQQKMLIITDYGEDYDILPKMLK